MNRRVVVSQLGARMHYAVPRLLHAAGALEHCYNDICGTQSWPRFLESLPTRVRPSFVRRLIGRVPEGVPNDRLTTFPAFGLRYAFARARAKSASEHTALSIWAGQTLSRNVLRQGFGAAEAVFGYSGECCELLAAARSRGLRAIVEQTIAPRGVVERLFAEECERFGDWKPRDPVDRAAADYGDREMAEWQEAHVILCGSAFVKAAIEAEGGPGHRCTVVPYGIDRKFRMAHRMRRGGPLRVLTVGEVGLRKGSPYVVEAARRLGTLAVFRMVGAVALGDKMRSRIAANVELTGVIPRTEMRDQFAWADVFLLPSMCEGSATAIYEALAAELPVICTPNAGSVISHGREGYIVGLRNVDAIVAALTQIAADKELLDAMSQQAGHLADDHTIEAYGRRLLAAIALDPCMGSPAAVQSPAVPHRLGRTAAAP